MSRLKTLLHVANPSTRNTQQPSLQVCRPVAQHTQHTQHAQQSMLHFAPPSPCNTQQGDNRIQCVQRTNLIGRRCARWRELGAVKGWEPVQLPLRCEQYKPSPGESDQRTALQRWPNLSTKLSVH